MAGRKLKVEKESEEKQVEELKGQLARTLADFDNFKKRTETEKAIWFKVSAGRVIGKFLSVMDMLSSAQKHLNDPGLAIILGEFKKAIEEEGFEEILIEIGVADFDHTNMEVVETVLTTKEGQANKIAEVVSSGWKAKETDGMDNFVVRHAKVKVFKNDTG